VTRLKSSHISLTSDDLRIRYQHTTKPIDRDEYENYILYEVIVGLEWTLGIRQALNTETRHVGDKK
jgi:hypothetical protein